MGCFQGLGSSVDFLFKILPGGDFGVFSPFNMKSKSAISAEGKVVELSEE